jgi:hypothetical protein
LKSTDISRTAPLHDPRSLTSLRTFLQCIDWRPVLEDNTPTAFASFDALLNEANLICCPPTTKILKTRPIEPWFTRGFMRSRFVEEKLHRQARQKTLKMHGANLERTEIYTTEPSEQPKCFTMAMNLTSLQKNPEEFGHWLGK